MGLYHIGWAGTSDGNVLNYLKRRWSKTRNAPVAAVGNTLGKTAYFGPVLSLRSEILLNKDIASEDYDNVGLGINRLINEGILKRQISEGISGYAEGGKVASALASGIDASSWVSNTFRRELSSDIKGKYEKIGVTGSSSGTTGPQGEGEYDSPSGAFMGATSAKCESDANHIHLESSRITLDFDCCLIIKHFAQCLSFACLALTNLLLAFRTIQTNGSVRDKQHLLHDK